MAIIIITPLNSVHTAFRLQSCFYLIPAADGRKEASVVLIDITESVFPYLTLWFQDL